MYLCGYHGTSEASANSILKDNSGYTPSSSEHEWLGTGIYFYSNFEDAYVWKDAEVVLHSVISVTPDQILDLDSERGMERYRDAEALLQKKVGKELTSDPIKNQCAICRIIWKNCPTIKVIRYSFALPVGDVMALVLANRKRCEFCVRDNSLIVNTVMIKKEEMRVRK